MQQNLSAIKIIETAAKKIPGVVSLAQGIPSLSSDDVIRQAVVEAIQQNKVDRYSLGAGIVELRDVISAKLARDNMRYGPEEIIVTAGAIEALSATFLGLLRQGDEVILFPPTYYANYKKIIEMAGGKVVDVPLQEQEDTWKLDLEALAKVVSEKTRAILICNPNNPTGSVFTKEELLAIGDLAKTHSLLLIFDDVYYHLVYGKEVYCLAKEQEYRDHIIRIVSLSKDFALTGWRIGFLHAPAELVQQIALTHDSLVNCAPVVSQYAALAALQNEEKIVPGAVQVYRERRERMGSLLEDMKEHLSFSMPAGSYYFFPKVYGLQDTMDFAMDVLQKAKVAFVPGEDFGPGGAGHIRLCFGRSEEDIQEGLSRLKAYFKGNMP